MNAQDTFLELQEFWRKAYSTLDIKNSDVQATLENWVSKVLTADGLDLQSSIRELFSSKPPEPFYGKWIDENGKLSVNNKTIVVLINPGDRISYAQCNDSEISLSGRTHWQFLKEFYTKGAVTFEGNSYHLPYTRKLFNQSYNYNSESGGKFAHGWWKSQWGNMLRAINETDEDETFLTLELFAYSSPKESPLSIKTVDALYSSRLVIQLIMNIIQSETTQPKKIILVGMREKI